VSAATGSARIFPAQVCSRASISNAPMTIASVTRSREIELRVLRLHALPRGGASRAWRTTVVADCGQISTTLFHGTRKKCGAVVRVFHQEAKSDGCVRH
jgi:hypothetical protein